MNPVGQIIRERREGLGLTLAALARAVGAAKSYLSMIENGRVANPPSSRLLRGLERALGIADGELTRAAAWQKTPEPVREQFEHVADRARRGQELAQWLQQAATQRDGGGRNLDKLFGTGELAQRISRTLDDPSPGTPGCLESLKSLESLGRFNAPRSAGGIDPHIPVRYQVPLINKVAAGCPTGFTDLDYPARMADSYVTCPELADPQAFAARVIGDSMLPEYHEGDVVVFSPQAPVVDGCDCFVRLEPDHEITFKRIYFEPGDPDAPDDAGAVGLPGISGIPGAAGDSEEPGTPAPGSGVSGSEAPGAGVPGVGAEMIRLQPLNPQFAPRRVQRQMIGGLYRAVWRFQKLR